jgi:sugar lactone lactonase YvrE
MRRLLIALGVVLVPALGYLLFWPVPVDPIAWSPPPNPGFTGRFARNDVLADVEVLLEGKGTGPEDVARGPDGYLYTGYGDGRIVRFPPKHPEKVGEFTTTGGRPLGLEFDAAGNLIVADALKGLLSVDAVGRVTVLTSSIDGEPMKFVDDVDVASDGTIWFSDASARFGIHDFIPLVLERRPTGRLLTYDPKTRATTVRLDGLAFANGVALGPDEAYVLVNESLAYRITRLWLKGPKAGQAEVFIDELPASPDNVTFNGRDRFWVAHFMPRAAELEQFADSPFVRTVVYRVLTLLPQAPPPSYAFVLGLDLEGNVVHNLQDPASEFSMITSANEIDGTLYLGSFLMPAVGRLPVPAP